MTNNQQPTPNDQRPTTNIYIGLGVNLGDRAHQLQRALEEMEKEGIKVTQQSALYETEAWGYEDQPAFLNQTVEVSTRLSPIDLLDRLQVIEKRLGRQERKRWHQREIDLDILYYSDQIVKTPDLQIPHPYVRERNFVLVPLAEIAGTFVDPETGESIQAALKQCTDSNTLTLYPDNRRTL